MRGQAGMRAAAPIGAVAAALLLLTLLVSAWACGARGNSIASTRPKLPVPGLRRAVYTLDADARTLQLAAGAHFDTVVQLFSWAQIEPEAGQYHWQYPDEIVAGAAYYGLDLVVRLDRQPAWTSRRSPEENAPSGDANALASAADYARFVRAVATRYRGSVLGYIVWNEPNLAIEWGGRAPDPAGYTALLRNAHAAIKEADPGALVISAGLASTGDQNSQAMDDRQYLEGMYRAGAAPYFDVLGAHPYGFAYPPDDPRGSHDGLNMARLADLRDIMIRYGDTDKPVWATEMGWTVKTDGPAGWQAVNEEQQADYLRRAYAMAGEQWPWLGLMAVWNLGGERGTQWDGYSLLAPSGQPRPAYLALQEHLLAHPRPAPPAGSRPQSLAAISRYQALASDVVIHLGRKAYDQPWAPLYGVAGVPGPANVAAGSASQWRGTFYLPDASRDLERDITRDPSTETAGKTEDDHTGDPAQGTWTLTMRIMQSNTPGNYLWVNGQRLEPPVPVEDDFHNVWVSYSWRVPAGYLRSGPNEIRVTIGRALPLIQDTPFTWDDLQFKDIILQKR